MANSAFTPTGTAAVNTVSNSDSSLTISPTTGAVIASLNVAHANTWTALQTFGASGNLYLNGSVAWEALFANGNSGTSKAVNLDNGNLQSITITGAVAITQTTPTHPGKYTLIVTQDGTGHVYSLSTIKWAGGTTPTYSTALNKVDIFSIIWDGTNYYGVAGIAFA